MEFSKSFIEICVGLAIGQFLTSLVCYYLIKTKVELLDHAKEVLISECYCLGIAGILHLIGFLLMLFEYKQNFVCHLALDSQLISNYATISHMCIMSILKLHLAKRTGENKIINHENVHFIIKMGTGIFAIFFLIIMTLSIHFEIPFLAVTLQCHEIPAEKVTVVGYPPLAFILIIYVAMIIVVLIYDVKMLNFISDFNAKHPQVFVTWISLEGKDTGLNRKYKLEKQLTETIPRVSLLIPTALLVFLPLSKVIFESFKPIKHFVHIGLKIMATLHIPMVLGLTFWSQSRKKRRKIVNPPTGLQFHQNESEFSESFAVSSEFSENKTERSGKPADGSENLFNRSENHAKQSENQASGSENIMNW